MTVQIPGPVFKAVRKRGKTGHDYDSLNNCVYVDESCYAYPIRDDADGIYYVKEHGFVVHIGRGCQQIISLSELEELLRKHEKGEL